MKKEVKSGIYCIENIINHKKYIGFAIDIEDRIKKHKSPLRNNKHYNKYLQRAWNKYKENNFKFWIVEEYPPEEEILKLMEIYFISFYNSFRDDGGGYNLTRGGDGLFGHIPTIESRKKSRESQLGEKSWKYGKHDSEETRKKKSISSTGRISSMLGKKYSDEQKKLWKKQRYGENSHFYGKPKSEKTRRLMSENHPDMNGKNNPRFGIKRKDSLSKYYGLYKIVIKSKNYISWAYTIGKKYIGRCKTEIESAHAYDKYVIENNIDRPLNFPNCDNIPYWEIK